jgi:hypothetical protein
LTEDLTAAELLTPPTDAKPKAMATARDADEWPEPLDFLADGSMTGAPELQPDHLPEAIAPFVFDTAARYRVACQRHG